MDLRHRAGCTAASMIAWLDDAQAGDLYAMVGARATQPARRLLLCAGIDLPHDFDLEQAAWRDPFLRELDVRLDGEDTSDDDSTTRIADYARFATDLRSLDALQALAERLAREEDVDVGAAFGWED